MAMNKQRKTSNLLNILNYDDAGNIVLRDYSQTIRYNWNGTIHAFTGPLSISSIAAAVTDTDRFLVSDGGVLKYRTGAEVLSDIGAFILPSLTSGSVLFSNGTTIAQNNANFFWDAANARLGIGTNVPATPLHIVGNSTFDGNNNHLINRNSAYYNTSDIVTNFEKVTIGWVSNVFNIDFSRGGSTSFRDVQLSVGGSGLLIRGSGSNIAGRITASYATNVGGVFGVTGSVTGTGSSFQYGSGVLTTISAGGTVPTSAFWISPYVASLGTGFNALLDVGTNSAANGGGTHTRYFAVLNNGNAILQAGGTFTDSGQRLQVQGTALITGNTEISAGNLSIFTTNTPRRLNIEQALGGVAAAIGLYAGGGTLNSVIGIDNEATKSLQLATTGNLIFYSGSTIGNIVTTPTNERMRLTSGGNLLVGTTADQGYRVQITSASADSQLNVWGATAPSIRLDNAASGATQRFVIGLATATNNFIQGANAGDVCMTPGTSSALVFGMWQTSSSSEVMRISTSSNVLIGTSTDVGAKLRVVGDISASVDLRLTRTGTSPAIILDQTQLRLVNQTSGFGIGLNVEQDIIRFGGAIRTNPPAGSGNPEYKLGSYSATAPTATGYLNIEVGGVVYKVLAST